MEHFRSQFIIERIMADFIQRGHEINAFQIIGLKEIHRAEFADIVVPERGAVGEMKMTCSCLAGGSSFFKMYFPSIRRWETSTAPSSMNKRYLPFLFRSEIVCPCNATMKSSGAMFLIIFS